MRAKHALAYFALVGIGVAYAEDIDAEIIQDLQFYQSFEVLEDLDQLEADAPESAPSPSPEGDRDE